MKNKIKVPNLIWKEVYIVKGWQTEIIKGIGVFFPKLQEGICTYEDYWLVFIENSLVPEKIYKTEVFEDLSKATYQIQKEKENYLKFCNEQVLKYSQKVTELTK